MPAVVMGKICAGWPESLWVQRTFAFTLLAARPDASVMEVLWMVPVVMPGLKVGVWAWAVAISTSRMNAAEAAVVCFRHDFGIDVYHTLRVRGRRRDLCPVSEKGDAGVAPTGRSRAVGG